MKYSCPICGYPDFDEPPWSGDNPSHDICPSCGVEFGYGDSGQHDFERRKRWRDLREKWVEKGMTWSSSVRSTPRDWDPVKQLKSIGADPANLAKS